MTDLFDKRSKKDRLCDYIHSRLYTRTSDVIKWGSANFSNRAERDARDLCAEGKIARMDKSQKELLFGNCKEDVWVPVTRTKCFSFIKAD